MDMRFDVRVTASKPRAAVRDIARYIGLGILQLKSHPMTHEATTPSGVELIIDRCCLDADRDPKPGMTIEMLQQPNNVLSSCGTFEVL